MLHEEMVEELWAKASENVKLHRAIMSHKKAFEEDPDADVHAVIGQYWERRRISPGQFVAIANICNLWEQGRLIHCLIRLREGSGDDKDIERHQSFLQGAKTFKSCNGDTDDMRLEGNVTCDRGRSASDDGQIRLLTDTEFYRSGMSESKTIKSGYVRVKAGSRFPLEIGYTMASRTWLHLLQEGCVARWPYGKPFLALLRSETNLLSSSASASAPRGETTGGSLAPNDARMSLFECSDR